MIRIAILGGGISGLTAAYELELARRHGAPIDWHLYEASDRLGGIIETTRVAAPEGEYVLEGGPDAWVSEKPWATELAIELGLESKLIYSNDATRKTYILRNGKLLPIPDHMRLMVPEDLSALDGSPLFTTSAKRAYAEELTRAAELRAAAPDEDESVASFVLRHFGDEVLTTLAAPLLSGVFGGDVHKLSVRAVMPQFVAMEREHGSLIAAQQSKSRQRATTPQPIFTSLRNGMASLTEALVARLSAARITTGIDTWVMDDVGKLTVMSGNPHRTFLGFITTIHTRSERDIAEGFDHVILATPLDVTRTFDGPLPISLKALLPEHASSAILVSLTWPASLANTFTLPPGFGFLIPPSHDAGAPSSTRSFTARQGGVKDASIGDGQLLACTFVDQKFPHRAPAGARILRAFFGGPPAETLASQPDEAIAAAAFTQLRTILGPVPEPAHTRIRRLPRSLPQYEVGHLDRITQLDSLVADIPGLHLLGNAYRGVGLPDLIRDARTTAHQLVSSLTTND